MLLEAKEIKAKSSLDCEFCVIGAGAAGITIARELAQQGRDVILLEGGQFAATEDSQQLYKGKCTEPQNPKHQEYLTYSRLRQFGGTTNHWAGWCQTLSRWDMTRRPWIPGSGWPVNRAELDPYYKKAAGILDIQPPADTKAWDDAKKKPLPFPPASTFETKIFQFSSPTRFGKKYKQELQEATSARVLVDANVTQIVTAGEGKAVSHVDVRTMEGKTYTVVAKRFVLAAGGIENARLMLLSQSTNPKGVGNENDMVGRHFGDHLESGWEVNRTGLFVSTNPRLCKSKSFHQMYGQRLADPVMKGVRTLGVLAPTERTCKEEEVLPFHFELRDLGKVNPGEAGALGLALRDAYYPGADDSMWLSPSKKLPHPGVALLNIRSEPTMSPDNRVVLSKTEKDSFGLARTELQWKFQDLDLHTHREAYRLFANMAGAEGLGRVKQNVDFDAELPFRMTQGGMHHTGTTRMSTNPKRGVVDKNCKVHTVDNLYVAGSSVYPTPGPCNPTWTLVGLALRLAEHLVAQPK